MPWRSTSGLLCQLTKSATCFGSPVREIFLCASVSAQRSRPRLRVGPVIRELLGRNLEVLPVRLAQRSSSRLSALLARPCLRRLQCTSFRCAHASILAPRTTAHHRPLCQPHIQRLGTCELIIIPDPEVLQLLPAQKHKYCLVYVTLPRRMPTAKANVRVCLHCA